MAEFFGDIERFFADLYPYRWALTIGALMAVTAAVAFGYRKGWHMALWRRRLAVAIIGTPVLAAVVVAGWWLGSPLFTSKTVIEEFPFSFNAVVPSGMTRSGVEETMSAMAKFDQRVLEAMPVSMVAEKTAAVKVKSGSFRDADSFHKGRGQATIYRSPDGSHLLRLENLDVTNGPDLHVVLTPHGSPDSRSDVKVAGYVDLGKLKGNKGDQNYDIPGQIDISAQGSVVIYCKPFAVVFSVATLEDEEFPFAANAIVPLGMTRAKVEQVMAEMAKFGLEVVEAMPEATIQKSQDDALMNGGMAMVKGGMAMVKGGMETSDEDLVEEGMGTIQEGAAMSDDLIITEEGMAMMHEGVEKSDEAMLNKAMTMLQEDVEKSAQAMSEQPSVVKLKTGSFRDADSFHKGSGQAAIYRGPDGSHILRLENLNVTNGPDLHVILTPHQNPKSRDDVKSTGYVNLGKLKGNKGDQNYPIPDDVDVEAQGSVVIYCKPFHVIFSVASLQIAG